MRSNFEFLYYKTVDPHDHVPPHTHDCVELVYYISGSGTTSINKALYQYSPCTFSINLPGLAHDQEHYTETQTIYIGFNFSDYPFKLESRLYHDGSDRIILTHLNEMKKEIIDKRSYYRIKLEDLLRSLLIEVNRLGSDPNHPGDGFIYVRKFIAENCTQTIDIRTLAEIAGYSYHRFRYLFKQETGSSPLNYILAHRIEKAKELLAATSMTVTAIASECGFYDHSQFCKYFKYNIGSTPGEYRKQMRRSHPLTE